MAHKLFIPPYLQDLGYGNFAELIALGRVAVAETSTSVEIESRWASWRGILEYMACVEFARNSLRDLPVGRAIETIHARSARYHSASLIFFAQATLDNIAVWLSRTYALGIKGSNCALHKSKFLKAVRALDNDLAEVLASHSSFLGELERFRRRWIHQLSGGARVFSDRTPMDSEAQPTIMIAMDPEIDLDRHGSEYVQQVERCRQANGGKWFYGVVEFADKFADGTLDCLRGSLARILVRET